MYKPEPSTLLRRRFHRRKPKASVASKRVIRNVVSHYLAPRQEVRYGFQTYASYQCDKDQGNASSAYFCLTDNIAQGGADINNRSGDRIFLKSIKFRFLTQMVPNQATANNVVMFRFLLVQFKEAVNTTAAIGSALKAIINPTLFLTPGEDGTNPDPLSMYNHDRRKQYAFLCDKVWTQVANGNAAGVALNNSMIRQMNIVVPMRKVLKQIEYINGSTTNAINHIVGLVITQNANAITSPPLFYGVSKIDFTDS